MKLRNKKTGDVFDFDSITDLCFGSKIQFQATNMHNKPIYIFNSLAELNDEWEDYEEPKEYWHIDFDGGLMQTSDIKCDKYVFDKLKEIGNYFETKEEADKVVEKLKAWKRLKDKGFRFKDFGRLNDRATMIRATSDESWSEIYDDLDLLFGGEDETQE